MIEAWRELMRRDPDALACQGPEWLEALRESGWRDVSRLYDHGVLMPLARRRGVVASMPEAWGMGGALADGVADLRPVVDDLRRHRALRVSVRPNPLHAAAWQAATAAVPHRALARRAHVLDLSDGAEAIFSDRFASSARRAVRKAAVDVRCATNRHALRDYRTLHDQSVERWAAAQHEPLALARARAYRRDPPEKLERLARAMGDSLRLWLAYRDGAPVAGIVVLLGPNASYTRGAMDKQRVAGANELLHWHAIREACAAGCRSYQMGESGGSVSLARFKEKLGARPIDYAEYRFERLPLTSADAMARRAVKRAVGFRDA